MLLAELLELIRNGENSGVDFKRDDVHPEKLAKELCALANFEGGHILLGVEDDGTISGLTRDPRKAEEWIMNICRGDALRPPLIPYWETVDVNGRTVGIVSLPADLPDKPYEAKRGSSWQVFIRRGSVSEEASRDEKARLYQSSGLLRYDIRPVPGTSLKDLDIRRLRAYFQYVREQDAPDTEDRLEWERLLINTDFMVEDRGRSISTVGGILLFGLNPNRWLPQAGITAIAYAGEERDYAAREDVRLRGPLTPLVNSVKDIVDNGLIDQAAGFVNRNIGHSSALVGARREDRTDYPMEAVREAVVNAVAHRDYTIAVADIEVAIFSDRMEIISPGRLPNTVTIDKMRSGYRATRNELIKEVLRDYRYVDARGLGVPRKIIRLMREINGTDPGLSEDDERFTVTLYRTDQSASHATRLQLNYVNPHRHHLTRGSRSAIPLIGQKGIPAPGGRGRVRGYRFRRVTKPIQSSGNSRCGPLGPGVDDDPDGADVIGGLVQVFVRGRGIEGDGVAGAQFVAVEADVGGQRAADDDSVLAAFVAQGPAFVGGVAAGGVDHLQEVGGRVGAGRESLPADAAGQIDEPAAVGPLHYVRVRGAGLRAGTAGAEYQVVQRAVQLGGQRVEHPYRGNRRAALDLRDQARGTADPAGQLADGQLPLLTDLTQPRSQPGLRVEGASGGLNRHGVKLHCTP